MPSASAKLEKQASLEVSEPIKQALTILEKKVRNLEKRKTKLDGYRTESARGKELNEDQKTAVARYDEVLTNLDFARDLQKQFGQIAQDAAKILKKQAKKEQVERHMHEFKRIQEILMIQDVLSGMGDETTREDFLHGRSGALTLTEENLDQLDKLYKLITPTHEVEEGGPTYEKQVVSATEHLVGLLDCKSKQILGTNYKELKTLIFSIHDCGYFSQLGTSVEEEEVANGEEELNQEDDGNYAEGSGVDTTELAEAQADVSAT